MTTDCTPDGDTAERSPDGDASAVPSDETRVEEDANREETVDAALARIRGRAETVRERELEAAIARLEARRDLSAADRAALEGLADRLVERMIAVPERSLREAADADDRETVETALSLFD